VLIGNIDLLPALFDKWIADPPAWLHVHEAPSRQSDHASVEGLDEGEAAAIALAILIDADLLLMDDRKGVMVARGKGLRVTGTLGVLDLAAQRGLVNFAQAVKRLLGTTFRIPEALLDSLVEKHGQRG
jgi:predicted nucleic acid-binding protein